MQKVPDDNDLLDDIAKGVDRLHDRAINIRDETQLHTRLLNDIDIDVDNTTQALKDETRHAAKIRKASGVCHLYITAAILFGVMILLIIVGLQ
eukprot:CAMPEP_0185766646 /NCGR_PEP_ID=MMETSP1174-20130828/38557_1 /TAXON_ID=35687 /ORGANISM="Dictyocha speculum, Strain CCMP1381" /LENGTH=92 /DNA_ID=CAMNT_0028450427 /DNA_START=92 /DNA_END=370 /DNA_ORIENTATION=+